MGTSTFLKCFQLPSTKTFSKPILPWVPSTTISALFSCYGNQIFTDPQDNKFIHYYICFFAFSLKFSTINLPSSSEHQMIPQSFHPLDKRPLFAPYLPAIEIATSSALLQIRNRLSGPDRLKHFMHPLRQVLDKIRAQSEDVILSR